MFFKVFFILGRNQHSEVLWPVSERWAVSQILPTTRFLPVHCIYFTVWQEMKTNHFGIFSCTQRAS